MNTIERNEIESLTNQLREVLTPEKYTNAFYTVFVHSFAGHLYNLTDLSIEEAVEVGTNLNVNVEVLVDDIKDEVVVDDLANLFAETLVGMASAIGYVNKNILANMASGMNINYP